MSFVSTCVRHPEKNAKRKCFRCKQVICIGCYFNRDHHIFCGRSCWLRWTAAERGGRVAAAMHRRMPLPLFLIAMLLAAFPLAYLILSVTRELDAPLLESFMHHAPRAPASVSAKITGIEEGERTMTVLGRSAPGALVFLLRDGKVILNGVAGDNGSFRFLLDLDSSEATYAVAAAPAGSVDTASFTPAPVAPPAAAVRSNQTKFVESFTRGAGSERELVLSFDAGSSDQGARDILDILRNRHIKTTVFLTGEFIHHFPAIVRQIVADGHEVGNHTWSHPHLTSFARDRRQATLAGMTRERFQAELRRTSEEFRSATGSEMSRYWRAPFGEENSEIRGWAAELGYLHVGWTRGRRYNLDSLDWVVDRQSPIYFSPEQVASRMLNFDVANGTTLNGGIILMHLGSDRGEDERISRALPMLISGLEEKGFRFVKVSELKGGSHAG
jgi:peptidoglycan-N-acetylglucosamine deacetylase